MKANRAALEKIVGPVSRETFDSLVELETQLGLWNQRINLVSGTTIDNAWARHILDAAQIIPLAQDATVWGDLGSGGGFPGLVLGIFMRSVPGGRVTLIESSAKKTAFLHHISGLMNLPVDVVTGRIERAVPSIQTPHIVTARALAPLPQLLELASPWLSSGAKGLFHKGRDYRRELEESSDKFTFDLIEHASSVDRDSVVLEINGLNKRSK